MLAGDPKSIRAALERGGPRSSGYLGYLLAVSGRRDEYLDSPGRVMLINGELGDNDRAFTALERTVEINWRLAATWLHRPEMAILRGDPRLPALRRKLGLPEWPRRRIVSSLRNWRASHPR